MPEIELNKLYTIGEVAEILRISESTVRRKIAKKKIAYIFDGVYRIPGNSLVEYLEKYLYNREKEGEA